MIRDYPNDTDGLLVTHDRGVLRLRLDRPERRNAITDDMVQALNACIEAAGSDESVRVIHLSGAGENFTSGFDLALRGGGGDKPRAGSTQRRMRWQVNRLIPTMLETQVPIVCAVQGWAMGLGLSLALASDFVVAADDARFRAPFTGVGFTPDSGVAWMLSHLVGVARAKQMVMLGRTITGHEAAQWGMIHAAVPSSKVDAAAEALTQELAASATVAVGLAKLLVHRSLTVDLTRHLEDEGMAIELSSRSDDFKEASRAAREKRKPGFSGR